MFSALKSAVIQINIHFQREMDEATLLGVLKGTLPPGPWVHHLGVFFVELPRQIVARVIADNGIPPARIEALRALLPRAYQPADIPAQGRNAGLGNPA